MTPAQLVRALQLTDSLFPVGGYAYSDGLETAASTGRVVDAESLSGWMDHYIAATFIPCEGLALLKSVRAVENNDWIAIRAIDQELTALKPAAAARASSRAIGKRLLAACATISAECRRLETELTECNAALAYGIALTLQGIGGREALLAFGYSRLAGMVSAGMRLIAMGHQQGQVVLARALDQLPPATEQVLRTEQEPLRSFNPLLDVQQMNHRYVYSRLFRS
jgi:urease accessory protein